jgi:glycogen debranching enzyme
VTQFDDDAVATWSERFVAAPAAFNAFAAHAALELAELRSAPEWAARGTDLAAAMDEVLWDDTEQLWSDYPIVGGGPSASIPTLDGVFGALVTADDSRAERALSQLTDPTRFGTPYGVGYLPVGHAAFDPDAYWRGPAWPQLNYLAWVAADRRGHSATTATIAQLSRAGAAASGLAEFWNPLTGAGRGAIPQGWGALAAAYPDDQPTM